jgi:hypothetical protein
VVDVNDEEKITNALNDITDKEFPISSWMIEWWSLDDNYQWVPNIARFSKPSEVIHTVEVDPDHLNEDGTPDARRKRVPEEWQEEWK